MLHGVQLIRGSTLRSDPLASSCAVPHIKFADWAGATSHSKPRSYLKRLIPGSLALLERDSGASSLLGHSISPTMAGKAE